MMTQIITTDEEGLLIEFRDRKEYVILSISWEEMHRQKTVDQILNLLEAKIANQRRLLEGARHANTDNV